MDKSDIIRQIDELMDVAIQLDNSFLYNRLFSIKSALISEWNESDLYYQIIAEELKKT
jgi:hypothetical protein